MQHPFFLFAFFVSIIASAQDTYELAAIEKLPLKASHFAGVDNFGDIYFVHNRTLHKKSVAATYDFKDFQLGNISSVDILNPLKITVFFPDYQTAVILDNRLNEIKRVSFAMEPPFLNIKNATTANDNRLWTFNEDTQQLELFNYREKTNQILSRPIAETYITHKSNFNFCYVLTDKNLRLYNIYGSMLKSIPGKGIEKIALYNNKIVILRDGRIYILNESLTEEKNIKIPELITKDLYLSDEFLYIYDGEMIHKMKLTKTQK